MNRIAVATIGAAALLAGCATTAQEPRIVVQEVRVPVPVSCVPDSLGPEPDYPDTDAALREAGPERFIQLLTGGRDLRDVRLGELEPVIEQCRRAPETAQ